MKPDMQRPVSGGYLVAVILVLLAQPCGATEARIATYLAQHFEATQLIKSPILGVRLNTAYVIQRHYVDLLIPKLGSVVGYKAGLTNAKAQQKFGIGEPVRGLLLADMMRPGSAAFPIEAGARLVLEADLLVRVASAAINTATNNRELLDALDAVIPFVEVPDLMFAQGESPDAAAVVAVNVGARFGVIGDAIPLTDELDWQRRLARFEVVVFDAQGATRGRGRGSDLLGHPLKVVEWLRTHLNEAGIQLKRGDLLSLGSLTPLLPAAGEERFRVRYFGLDARRSVELAVHFTVRAN